MPNLSIDTVNAPQVIINSLHALSNQISFEKVSLKGTNGYLFIGHNHVLDRKVAIKYYYWGGDPRFHAEPQQLAQIQSENVVQIYHAELLDNDWAFFVTQFCPRGDLDDLLEISPLGLKNAIDILINLLSGLSHLHGNRFVHRDLKPQNILISDEQIALIGDFGSVKRIPQDRESIPASGHAVLYRPPEAANNDEYGFKSDIYQLGIILYQVLGGYLPYEETAWLNRLNHRHYNKLIDPIDKSIYVDNIIKNKIIRGTLLNISSLPPWVTTRLKRAINRATNVNVDRRYESAAAFLAQLHSLRAEIPNWQIENGYPALLGTTSYRIVRVESGRYRVEKKRTGNWRRDNAFGITGLSDQVQAIENSL